MSKTALEKDVTIYRSEILLAQQGPCGVRVAMDNDGLHYRVTERDGASQFAEYGLRDIFWTTEESRLREWLRANRPELFKAVFGISKKEAI